MLTVGSGVSEIHAGQVGFAIGDMPTHVAQTLADKGVKVAAVSSARDVLSEEISGMKPRGYTTGTYGDVGAAYDPNTKVAFVCEFEGPVRDDGTRAELSRGARSVARHEIGHAVDDNLLDHRISGRDDFQTAYREDLRNIMDSSGSSFIENGYSLNGKAAELSYYIQPALNPVSNRFHVSPAGYSEGFAEGFAAINGGGAHDAGEFKTLFPNTIKVIETIINASDSSKGRSRRSKVKG